MTPREEAEEGACCAHVTVIQKAVENNGLFHDEWHCKDCDTPFIPAVVVKNLRAELQSERVDPLIQVADVYYHIAVRLTEENAKLASEKKEMEGRMEVFDSEAGAEIGLTIQRLPKDHPWRYQVSWKHEPKPEDEEFSTCLDGKVWDFHRYATLDEAIQFAKSLLSPHQEGAEKEG